MALVQAIFDKELRRRAAPALPVAVAVAADPVARALARLGDQAAHAEPGRVHARVQRLAREHPEPRARAGVRDQALLPPRLGRRLALPFRRRHHQRRAGPRAQVRGAASWSASYLRDRPARRTAPGEPTSCARISWPPTRCRWRTTSRASVVVPARRLVGLPGEYDGHPSLKLARELRVAAVPAPRRRHPPRLRQADRRGHGRDPACSAPTSSRSPATTLERMVRGRGAARRVHRADARARRGGTPRAPTRAFRSVRPKPRLVGGKPDQEPALPAGAARRGASARSLRGGDGRAALPAAPAARAGAVPGHQRALGPPQQPAGRRASGRCACTGPSTTRSCPSCSWTTSAR